MHRASKFGHLRYQLALHVIQKFYKSYKNLLHLLKLKSVSEKHLL